MKRTAQLITATAISFAAAAFAASSAGATGAVALGIPPNVAKNGAAYGYGVNFSTVEAARREALAQCRKFGTKVTAPLCRVTDTFENKCTAMAFDPAPGTPGVGWALGESKRAAERDALAACERTAGPGRRAACAVQKSACDGTAE